MLNTVLKPKTNRNQRFLEVNNENFGEIINKWMFIDFGENRSLYLYHTHHFNPSRNKYTLFQIILSNFQLRYYESVFESFKTVSNWIQTVQKDGMNYPKLSVNNSCFSVLKWGNSKVPVNRRNLEESFDKFIVENEFVKESDLLEIRKHGLSGNSIDWIEALF